jgi:hypothetical protein
MDWLVRRLIGATKPAGPRPLFQSTLFLMAGTAPLRARFFLGRAGVPAGCQTSPFCRLLLSAPHSWLFPVPQGSPPCGVARVADPDAPVPCVRIFSDF